MPNKVKLENPITPVSLTLAQDANLFYLNLKTFIWRNTWAATPTTYGVYDVVYYNGSSYVNKTGTNTSTNPASDTTNWDLMVQKGDTGATGATGAAGVIQSISPTSGSPITVVGGTTANPTIGINQSLIAIDPSQVTGTAVITTDSRLSDSRVPKDAAGGDLTSNYPNPSLVAVGTSGTYTKVTTDTKGRVTSGTTLASSDLPSVTRSDTGSVAATNFVKSVTSDTYGRLTGITLSTVPGITIGSTGVLLGDTVTTISGLTSVTSTGFTGALTGNASTATNLASGTTTLASNVVNSSLTSVGTLANLTVTNAISGSVTGNAGTVTNGAYINAANTFTAGPQTINIDAIGNKGIVIKAASGQTANLLEVQPDGSTTPIAKVDASGNFTANTIAVTNQATTRTNLSLGNVDNTSDVNKPISNATQTELNKKADFNIAVALSVAL